VTFFHLQLKTLINFLTDQKIKYVILGGVAVSIYGEPRLTADIDVNIILGKNTIDEFLKKARKYNLYPASTNVKKIAKKTGVMPLLFTKRKISGKCDIIMAENQLEYTAIKRGKTRTIGNIKMRVVSPEDLIIHKITSSRPRDIEDLRGILIRQRGKLDIKYINAWLRKIDKVNKKSQLYKLFTRLRKTFS